MKNLLTGFFFRYYVAFGQLKACRACFDRYSPEERERFIRERSSRPRLLALNLAALARELWKTRASLEQSIRLMQESRDLAPSPSKEKWLALRYYEAGKLPECRIALERALRALFQTDSEMMKLHKMTRAFFMEDAERNGFMMFHDLSPDLLKLCRRSGEMSRDPLPGSMTEISEAVICGDLSHGSADEPGIRGSIADAFKAAGLAVRSGDNDLPPPGSIVMEMTPGTPEIMFIHGGETAVCGVSVPDRAGEAELRTPAAEERIRRSLMRGNPVFALYAPDINNHLPQVSLVFDPHDIPFIINSLNPEELYARRLFGRRALFRKYPEYADPRYCAASEGKGERACEGESGGEAGGERERGGDRGGEAGGERERGGDRGGEAPDLSSVSDRVSPALPEIRVLVVGEDTEVFRANLSRQTYECREACREAELKNRDLSHYQLIAWFSDQDCYEEWYLEDMVNAFRLTGADFVSKEAYYLGRDFISGPELCEIKAFSHVRSAVFRVAAYAREDILNKRFSGAVKGYAGDRFNYIRDFRLPGDPASAGGASSGCSPLFREGSLERKPELTVILPVYNNGDFLYFKAFASLLRLAVFQKCEIIIADDGSDDARTLAVINWLSRHYANVKVCLLPRGGSGSASRPRNRALEMASGDYVLFFDPDDECLGDAYSVMLRQAREARADLVIGNNCRAGARLVSFNNYARMLLIFDGAPVRQFENGLLISDLAFRTPRIQSMLIKTELARRISFVEGAIGEDTLYSWEIMKLARNFVLTDRYTHVYYAGRTGSATNSFTPDTFRKLLRGQPGKIAFLKENGILETYMNSFYKTQIAGRLKSMLKECPDSARAECAEIAKEITGLYEEARRSESGRM